jgi:hypothetical protein
MIKTILSSALIVMALVVSIQQQAKAIEQIPYYPPLKGDQIQKELHKEKEISIWHNFTSTNDNHTSPTVLISSPPIFNKQAGSVIWACSTTLESVDMKNDKKVGKIVRNGLKLCDNDMPYLKGVCEKTNDGYSYCDRNSSIYQDLWRYLFGRGLLSEPRPDSPVSRALGG